jgi:VCBS repeat-containing protein
VQSTDAGGLSTTQNLTVTVTDLNEAPTADDDAFTVSFLVSTTIEASGVLSNDRDEDAGSTLAVANADTETSGIQPVKAPQNGTLVLRADGSFTYTPAALFAGEDSFTYKATDGTNLSNEATVKITVSANTPPVAVDNSTATDEDTAKEIDVITNDTDAQSANSSLFVKEGSITSVKGGTAVLQDDNRTVRFTPTANANDGNTAGGFGFSYKTTDGVDESLTAATVTITVNAVNDAPVLDNSGNTTLTVGSPNGTSIQALIATGANGDPISDVDAGAVEGIAVVEANTRTGIWQYSLDSGQSWQALGAVSGSSARLLAADAAGATRLRFLQTNGGGTTPGNLLTFYAWDQTSGSNGEPAAGDLADASARGGSSAYSVDAEVVAVQAPNDASPRVLISAPVLGRTYAGTALSQAQGTASDSDGISEVRVRLFRYATNGNSAGFWNGSTTAPVYEAAFNAGQHERLALSSNGYANWSLALPALVSGKYYLQALARDTQGNWSTRRHLFYFNDASPQVKITTPANGSTQAGTALRQAQGTADDNNGISGVRVRLYRYANHGNTAGFWNGSRTSPVYAAAYNAGQHERSASSSDSYANWSLALPALAPGQYYLQATARDNHGNTNSTRNVFTINDGSPALEILTPAHRQSYTSAELEAAGGTATDGDGISSVDLVLYRYATNGNTAGFWNGNLVSPGYGSAAQEIVAQGTNTWEVTLPELAEGQYYVQVRVYDGVGNWSVKRHLFYIKAAESNATATDSSQLSSASSATAAGSSVSGGEASASASSITLNFSGSGTVPGAFSVTVNGQSVTARSVERTGSSIVLLLPDGSIKTGDEVNVSWNGGSINLTAE